VDARVLEAEWLDVLPPSDPRALRSRRDLARVNALMGNARIVRGELRRFAPIRSLAEIGAGDGRFALSIAAGLATRPRKVTLVDRQAIVAPQTRAALGCEVEIAEADVFEWLERAGETYDAIVANLFLHHFDDDALVRMLALIAGRARVLVACEPRRGAIAMIGARLLGLVGCNDVTRHDAIVSIRAGFSGAELTSMWPAGWTCTEGARGVFSHAFTAYRA
jgi:hypothetical protein